MKALRTFSRILVGLVFIFSGFVKAVDPLGSTYKFQDYFAAAGLSFFDPIALYLAMLLCAAEFLIGIGLLFCVRIRLSAWALFIFMFFFTMLTLILAIYNPVSDCGCFGDAIKLTNWQTFYKNLIFMVFTLIVFFQRRKFREAGRFANWSVIGISTAFIFGVMVYALTHLPLIDFLPWKKGSMIADQLIPTPEVAEIYLVYRNTETGEQLEYTSATLPWQDSVLMSKLEFVDQRKVVIQDFIEAPIHDFSISDREHNDYTADIIQNPDYNFLLVAYDVDKACTRSFDRINEINKLCQEFGYTFVGVSGSIFDQIDSFSKKVGGDYEWYSVDKTALKTAIRSNPGLILLKDGVVIDKWHHLQIPSAAEMKAKYFSGKP
jgi:uncharacterized membrane protein YphA (DoxX/SURF4 family)